MTPGRLRLDGAREVGPEVGVRLWSHAEGVFEAPAAAHPAVELVWVEAGEVAYRVGGREFEVRAGEAAVVPREVEHVTLLRSSTRAGVLALGGAMIAEVADAIGAAGQRVQLGVLGSGARVAGLGALVRAETIGAEIGHLVAVEALAEAMTVAMLRGADTRVLGAHARDPRVTAALDRIHAGYAEPLGIEDLARAAGMGRFHFSRLFREAVGRSPYQYLLRTRVDRAAELLRSGRTSVTEAALAVGFADLGRFARAFRVVKGKAPSAWAREARPTRRR